ncbi:MAG: hypothetical protein NVS2B14_05060 [Chamaesiphon sp.]
MISHYQLSPKWLRFVCIVVLVIGIFFRFVNLEKKVYWEDETYTSLWIAGYNYDISNQLYNGREVSIQDLQKYLHINSDKSLLDTLKHGGMILSILSRYLVS